MEHPRLVRILNNRRRWRVFFGLYAAALTVALLWPKLTLPPVMPRPDLLGHYVAFGVFSLLLCLWNPVGTPRQLINAAVSFAAGAAYGAVTEVLQSIPVLHRTAGLDDWTADVLGVGCGVLAFWAVHTWRSSRSAPDPCRADT